MLGQAQSPPPSPSKTKHTIILMRDKWLCMYIPQRQRRKRRNSPENRPRFGPALLRPRALAVWNSWPAWTTSKVTPPEVLLCESLANHSFECLTRSTDASIYHQNSVHILIYCDT